MRRKDSTSVIEAQAHICDKDEPEGKRIGRVETALRAGELVS